MQVSSSINALSTLFTIEKSKEPQALQSISAKLGSDTVNISASARALAAQMGSEKNSNNDGAQHKVEADTLDTPTNQSGQGDKATDLAALDAEGLQKRFSELISQKHREESTEEKIAKLKLKLAEIAMKKEKTQEDMKRMEVLQAQLSSLEGQLAKEKQAEAAEAAGAAGNSSGSKSDYSKASAANAAGASATASTGSAFSANAASTGGTGAKK